MNRELTADERYNELNIVYRICRRFSPKKFDELIYHSFAVSFSRLNRKEDPLCFCNRPVDNQHRKDPHSEGIQWDMLQNTSEEVNHHHGKLSTGAWVRGKNFASIDLDE